MLKRTKNLVSGVRTMSVTVEGGTTKLGVNLEKGEAPGVVNRYNVEFKNGSSEPLIDCLDCSLVHRVIFRKEIKKMDEHIDAILEKKGYFTNW